MPQYPGGADGLYFTIDAKGDVEWENDFNGTLNNVVACKHNILWGAGDIFYSSVDHDFITVEGMPGFIAKFHDWCHGTLEVRNNCGWLDILWLGCSDNCGIGTGIQLAEPVLFECDNPKWVGILADDDPEGYKWDYDSEGVYRAVARHSVCEGCGSYTLIECSADYVAGIEWKEY
ncbi:MAG: hypothetical protein FWE67_03705, partial [Planctomycetaceae bacterium]|nr:hypothetical protein [Planctomycetaceae bacterium]